MAKLSEPDYEAWCKVDEWTFKDAALLLNGLDPLNYQSVKFNLKETPKPSELKASYMTFLSLKNFNGGKGKYLTGAAPQGIIFIAQARQLPIPSKLYQCFEKRMKLEEKQPLPTSTLEAELENQTDKNLSARERDNLLKAIGLFIAILFDSPEYKKRILIKGRINASQVMQLLLDKASELKINPQGIKSLNRKINDAITLLMEDKSDE